MKRTSLLLMCVSFIFSLSNLIQGQTISYGTAGSTYTQDFNTLPNTGTFTFSGGGPFSLSASPVSASGLTGWYGCKYSGTATNMIFLVENGSSTTGGVHNYGATSMTDRALGCLASAGNIDEIGALITNNTGVTLTQITIAFTGEQWRTGSGSANTLSFQYKIGASSINDATGYLSNSNLNFSSPNTAKGDSATNGNSAGDRTSISYTISGLTWNNGDVLGIRWQDVNDVGNDDGLAIDDLTFSASTQATGTFSVTGSLTPFSQTSAAHTAEQSYNISGTGLTTNVTIVPPAGFEVSKTTGSGFVNSTGSLVYTAAEVIAGKTIYVRMNANTPGVYSGNISHTSGSFEFAPASQPVSGTYTANYVLSLTALIEGMYSGSVMVPDTVTVELHNATTFALVDQSKGLLDASGNGSFSFGTAVNNTNYYIAVKYRNAIETWSSSTPNFTNYALNYNFTTSAAQAFGSNLVLKSGKYCIYSGDVNQDGAIDIYDLSEVDNDVANFASGYIRTDVNYDNAVDIFDLSIVGNNDAEFISKNIPIQSPALSITGTLSAFSQTSSTPSTEQTYTLNGTNLTANVTLVPPAGFEISKTTSSGFVTSAGSLVYTAAEVMAGKTIYVRMNAGSAGNYSGNISHTSANSEFIQVSKFVSGSYVILPSNVNLTMGNPSGATIDVNNPHNYLLVRDVFCASYDSARGIPNWTSWQLNSSWLGSATRKDNYIPDGLVPGAWYHVVTGDYTGSNFSRGHMCPSADRTNSQSNNDSLFYMTNMIPQNQDNNAGAWEGLETYERTLANAGNTLYIISGGYGAGGKAPGSSTIVTTIAGGKVTVPAKLWKVIIVIPPGSGSDISRVTTSTRTIAMLIDNDSVANTPSLWGNYRVSVDSIEALTGFDFFSNVPTAIQAVIEANIDTGPTN